MRGAVRARVDAIAPALELVLEVQLIGKAPPGLEVAVQEAVASLERALGLAVAGVEDHPAERELPAEGEELLRGLTLRGDRALAVPDELRRQGAEALQAAAHAEGDVLKLLGEHERAGERARIGKVAGDDESAPRLPESDRDLPSRLAEVELAELPGSIAGALEAPRRRQIARAQLAQEHAQDRHRARIAERLDLLANAHGRERRLVGQQLLDARQVRVELGWPPGARAIARRLAAGQGTTDRVAVKAGAPADLPLREALDVLHPPDLRPLLHVKQRLPPVSIALIEPGSAVRPEDSGPCDGWTSFRPSQVAQYSGVAYMPHQSPTTTTSSADPPVRLVLVIRFSRTPSRFRGAPAACPLAPALTLCT